MAYTPSEQRYETMRYNYCGNSGLMLPAISLGLWQNFGTNADRDTMRSLLTTAFDRGITHFDLANNYGPEPGSAEKNFGTILKEDLSAYRDQLIVSTKAGYSMWEGPYGNWGSKKYLVASLDQSLRRMGLDYVDIFYHHRPDPNTPLEEVAHTLDLIVRQGKALYVGISNYSAEQTTEMIRLLNRLGTPFIIHQARYNMLDRTIEQGDPSLCEVLDRSGIGCIAFSPLAQGVLADRYARGIPEDSRMAKSQTIPQKVYNADNLDKVAALARLAVERGQTIAQTALAWVLNNPVVTSVLIGASTVAQLLENLGALDNADFGEDELDAIDEILNA